MAIILSIESSGTICSVALHNNGELLACIESDEPNIHGQKLAVFINEITESQKIDIASLDAIAVSEGPGSYTGLRIGVSLAKGLCYAKNIPLISVDTLKALAWAIRNCEYIEFPNNCLLMPMIDARRMEVYTASFDMQLSKISKTMPLILDELFYTTLSRPTLIAGNGSLKIIPSNAEGLISILPEITFSAKHLGWLAYQNYLNSAFEDLTYFEPVYLKEFAKIL